MALFSLTRQSNVFMYYGLSNFYQNHRRYVKSRDDSQLNGNEESLRVRSEAEQSFRSHFLFTLVVNDTLVHVLLSSVRSELIEVVLTGL